MGPEMRATLADGPLSLMAHVATPGDPACSLQDAMREMPAAGVQIGIGPEGGFTEDEIEFAIANGWRLVGLGRRILRTETAALALVAQTILMAEQIRPPT